MWVEITKWLKRSGYQASDLTADYHVYTTEIDLVVDGDQLVRLLGPEGEAALAEFCFGSRSYLVALAGCRRTNDDRGRKRL